ncbi:histidine phosphatase family protein [Aeoliella mucimassa]|uniref:Phosphoserine phosphatase 1 n=1 Tax=Aeoliella mucimassa TaxID=2527972 RepID=A0A518AMB9_9BACT|nr:histidine phosphatase family protein [Aeoliella mucimassa]QDU55872.1 Phosphoserine phosphatase 1 [Aeoliella mucimassa]
MSDACHIYLIRHGATAHNLLDPPRMQGRHIDEPLTELGQSQAAQAAVALQSKPLAAVYASPLRRAMETAQAIAGAHRLDPTALEGLAEADVGRWEDRAWVEIAQNDKEAYLGFRNDPVAQGYPDGEDLGTVYERVAEAIDQVASQHLGQVIAVVAHSVVNRVYLGGLLGVPFALRRKIPQDNCNYSLVKWTTKKQSVVTVNAVHHLES